MRTLLLTLLMLALFPAVVLAQADDPVSDADPPAVVDGDPPAGDPRDDGAAEDACERGGADADYTYCGEEDCVDGADDDYVYDVECFPAAGGDDEGGGGPGGGAQPTAQALPASELPLTGGEPLVIALLGAAFVLLGAGLRPRGAART